MIQGLIGKKVGMTHLFGAESRVIPVTVLEVGPCVVTQVRTAERDGYAAVQVGFGHAKQLSKPERGHLRASGAQSRVLREFPAEDASAHQVGQTVPVTQFQPGDIIDVTATSKGRGFQGAVKRYGFGGGRKTHGQGDRYRAVGSIGAGTFPGRVLKGKKMPGHMGNRQVTARKLVVERVDPQRNLLMVRGAVPGTRNGIVTVRYAKGLPITDRLTEEQWAELIGTPIADEPEAAVDETVAEEPVAGEPIAEEPVAETEDATTAQAPEEAPAAKAAIEEPGPSDEAPANQDEEKKAE
jgi:large subunit ribosomal protein L3